MVGVVEVYFVHVECLNWFGGFAEMGLGLMSLD